MVNLIKWGNNGFRDYKYISSQKCNVSDNTDKICLESKDDKKHILKLTRYPRKIEFLKC